MIELKATGEIALSGEDGQPPRRLLPEDGPDYRQALARWSAEFRGEQFPTPAEPESKRRA